MAELPSGTVTFLFTDIEGSTARWEHQPVAMQVALARHDALLRAAIVEHGGHVVKTMGDAFHAVFVRAPDAVAAALDAQRRLQAEPWGEIGPIRVRMAVHTGGAEERDGDYYGPPLNRAARLMSAGHGGQVLLSQTTYDLVRDAPPERTSLLDLGEHRLKDLIRPERIFQLVAPDLPSAFPLLRSLESRPHNLPVQATALLGREREIAKIRERLLRADVRLLTLTGPGGTGKTRLSLQIAAELLDQFTDGVLFVALAPISDPDLVSSTIAQTLGIRADGNRPIVESLRDHLSGKQMLLLLDNFEQILAAAPTVSELLSAAPRLKILVTSRAALQVRGEHEEAVPPLALPDRQQTSDPAAFSQYGAVALFVERAAAIKADFTVTNENAPAVAEICHRLDGLPLAIELAAARTRLLSPRAVLARLERRLPLLTGGARDLPARQQTLRNTIAWSYDLLTPEEQALFRRLAVFVGGCTLEAAEAVCDHDGTLGLDVVDGVTSLVAQSLLRQLEGPDGDTRFGMLETIREFGLEQLEAGGEIAALHQRHVDFYLALAEAAEQHVIGPEQAKWLLRLEAEHDNLRAALAWSQSSADPSYGIRLAGALRPFWHIRGHWAEGRRWLETALAKAGIESGLAEAKALNAAGQLAWNQGDYEQASAFGERALELSRALDDPWSIAWSLGRLALVRWKQGAYEEGTVLSEEGLALFRTLGATWYIGWSLNTLGRIAQDQGRLDQAFARFAEALPLFRALGEVQGLTGQLAGLGDIAVARGEYEQATALYEECLAVARRAAFKQWMILVLHSLGRLASIKRNVAAARDYIRESLVICSETGDRQGIAASFEGLARVALSLEHAESLRLIRRGVQLLAAASALRSTLGSPLPPADRATQERELAAACDMLGERAFQAAWVEGQAMTMEQAVACALSE